MTERQQIQLFVDGLGQPLQTDVELQAPQSLESAMSLAHAYECRSQLAVPVAVPPSQRPWHAGGAANPAPGLGASDDSGSSTLPTTAGLPHRTLSPVELERRCSQGLCYHCDEKFFVGLRCKRLFVIEIQPELKDADTGTGIEPEISLAALTDIQPRSGQTM